MLVLICESEAIAVKDVEKLQKIVRSRSCKNSDQQQTPWNYLAEKHFANKIIIYGQVT